MEVEQQQTQQEQSNNVEPPRATPVENVEIAQAVIEPTFSSEVDTTNEPVHAQAVTKTPINGGNVTFQITSSETPSPGMFQSNLRSLFHTTALPFFSQLVIKKKLTNKQKQKTAFSAQKQNFSFCNSLKCECTKNTKTSFDLKVEFLILFSFPISFF